MTAIKYRTADVDGSKVFYREAGPADAPKLLLLHGFPTASHMFRDLIPLLADRWHMADELGVQPSACCMIAAHVWDTIGAQSAGLAAGLILRSGNAPLLVPGLPQPHVVARDLPALAAELIKLWRP